MSIKQQLTDLHNALRQDDIPTIKALTEKTPELVHKAHLDVCALELCQSDEAIEIVIGQGADLNRLNKRGNSALYAYTFSRRLDLVQKLLSLGADLNQQGDALLLLSINQRDEDLVAFWLAQGIWSEEALHECASSGNPESMSLLLQWPHASTSQVNAQGQTPLDVAMSYSSPRHKAIVELLLAHKTSEADDTPSGIQVSESTVGAPDSPKPASDTLWGRVKGLFGKKVDPVDVAAASDDPFWSLIALLDVKTNTSEVATLPLEAELVKRGVEEIHRFDQTLTEMLYRLDGPAWMNHAGESGSSDDAFLYARCYVVARGRDYFNQVLTNPRKMPRSVNHWFEPLLYVAPNAWSKLTGEDSLEFESRSELSYETGSHEQNWGEGKVRLTR